MKVPGLFDLQVNGYKGVDFSGIELTEQQCVQACRELLNAGTSAFLPTVITGSEEMYKHNLPILARVIQASEFKGRLPGLHIEGPFISPKEGFRGAHQAEFIRKPNIDFLKNLIEWSGNTIKLLTIAAELEGAEKLTRFAVRQGIAVSLGHQTADERDMEKLARAGAVSLTHLGNGIPANLPRHHNPIWAGLANDDLTAIFITDGHHLPPAVMKTFIRTKGVAHCIVVSDASPIAGLQPGSYSTLGNDAVLEENGRLYNPHAGHLVGSSATMLQCMNYLAGLNLLTPQQLIEVGFYNPLKLIGADPASIPTSSEIVFDERENLFVCMENREFKGEPL